MNAPFFKFDYFNSEIGLIFAFIIGIGFGFFLERAGFGSSRKLAAQFYFYDMTVFKVMFTAIVTAMLGIYYLSVIGFVDLSLVYTPATRLIPQIVGGLLLGVGFVIGGYCPGTSTVAMATGKIDAASYLVGIFAGIFIFGLTYDSIIDFFYMTDMGRMTISDYFDIPYGWVVFLVVLIAVGGFAGATWVEKKFQHLKSE